MLRRAIEPVPIDDIFLNGIDFVEEIPGDLVRFWMYVEENGERIIRCKTVLPKKAVLEIHADVTHQLHVANDFQRIE